MNGKVKFFDETKGFGFIVSDDGKEFFVHQSGLKEGVRLNDNDAVVFDIEDGDRGPKAVNVALDSGSSEESESSEGSEGSEE